jgi:replicative DNA helicase
LTEETQQFAATPEYQAQVLAFMLSSPQFKDIASDALSSEQFGNKVLQWYYKKLADAPISLSAVTLKEELLRAVQDKQIKEGDIDSYVATFEQISVRPSPMVEEHIRSSIGEFIRTQQVKKAILGSFDLIKEGKWDEISSVVTDATNAGIDLLSLGQDYFAEYEERIVRRVNREEARRIPTGIPQLDELTNGGIKNKQMGIIFGGTGRGKSIFLQWLARVALMLGKKVVYFTLELDEDSIADRFDSMFCRIQPHKLPLCVEESKEKMAELAPRFGGSLWIKEYAADEVTIQGLKTYVAQLQAQGVDPDLICLDYLGLVKPHRNYNDVHAEVDSITKACHGMAKSLDIAVWTADQLNRAGMVQENPDETSIAGYVGKLYTCDIGLTMGQTNDEREDGEMRLGLMKNRNGPAGRTVKIDTDYSYMQFYRAPILGEKKEEPKNDNKPTNEDGEGGEGVLVM